MFVVHSEVMFSEPCVIISCSLHFGRALPLVVLSYEDKRLLRLAYYLLQELTFTHNERSRYMDTIQERMRADIAAGGVRAIMAIKTFSGYHHSMTGQSMLSDFSPPNSASAIVLDTVRKVIKREEQDVVVDTGKKKGKGIFGKKDKKSDTPSQSLDNWFYYTTLFEMRSRLVPQITPTEFPVSDLCFIALTA